MAGKYWHPVVSVPALHFTELLAQDGISANYDLALPFTGPLTVRAERIISLQNLTYELWLFDSATNMGGTIATDHFLSCWQFGALVAGPPASPGYRVGGAGYYRFYTEGFETPYTDADYVSGVGRVPLLHVRLVCRSAAGKSAYGAGGDLQVAFQVTAQGEYA
jgi:hypothetical protein